MQDMKQFKIKVNVHRDDFVDEVGRLHTRIEIITSPLTYEQGIKPINLVPSRPRLIMRKRDLQPQVQQMPQEFPAMDISTLMQRGKDFLDASGVDIKEIFKELTQVEPIEIDSEEDVEEQESTEVDENTAKAYLNNMLVPETKPEKKTSKNKKEVKNKTKWQKIQKTKQQNQKKKK